MLAIVALEESLRELLGCGSVGIGAHCGMFRTVVPFAALTTADGHFFGDRKMACCTFKEVLFCFVGLGGFLWHHDALLCLLLLFLVLFGRRREQCSS